MLALSVTTVEAVGALLSYGKIHVNNILIFLLLSFLLLEHCKHVILKNSTFCLITACYLPMKNYCSITDKSGML